ncbi:MAG: hypothetical protein RLZZ299_2010 [Pseudomonadota bacterium]|jgi:membrane protein implicated in regulation of membrane protease activity
MMMLWFHVAALTLGGALLVFSAAGLDKDVDAHHAEPGDLAHGVDSSAALAVLGSLRFWTFFLAAFGAAGLLLHAVGLSVWWRLPLSLATGVVIGVGAWWAFRVLAIGTVNSALDTRSLAGKEGDVVLAVAPDRPGKVRIAHQGQHIEMFASTREPVTIARGARVLVVEVRDGCADVTPLAPSHPSPH